MSTWAASRLPAHTAGGGARSCSLPAAVLRNSQRLRCCRLQLWACLLCCAAAAVHAAIVQHMLLGWRQQRAVYRQLGRDLVLRSQRGSCIQQLRHVRLALRCVVCIPVPLLLLLLPCLQPRLLQLLTARLVPVHTRWTEARGMPKAGVVGGARRQAAKVTRAICCSVACMSCGTEITSKDDDRLAPAQLPVTAGSQAICLTTTAIPLQVSHQGM